MRLVAWNIRAGGGVRATRIVRQLTAWQPDLVALSEFRATAPSHLIADELRDYGLTYQRTTANLQTPSVNSLLVASRWPLRQIRLRRSPDNPYRWLHVTVAAPSPFAVLALHVPNRSSGRKYPFLQSVLDVISEWRGAPAIIMGDTNSGRTGIDEENRTFNRIENHWMSSMEALGWCDVFRHLHAETREFTWYSPNGKNGFRLDQMFLHPDFTRRSMQFNHHWGGDNKQRRDELSDHAALVLDIDTG